MQVKKVKNDFKIKQKKKRIIHKKSSMQKQDISHSTKDNDKTSKAVSIKKISSNKADTQKLQSSTDTKQKNKTKDSKKKTIRNKEQYRKTNWLSRHYMKKIESISHPTLSDVKVKSSNAILNHLNRINEPKDEAPTNVNLLSYATNEAKLYKSFSKVIRADTNKKKNNTHNQTSKYKKVQKKKHVPRNTKYSQTKKININTLKTSDPNAKLKVSRCRIKKKTNVISHKGNKKGKPGAPQNRMHTYVRQKIRGEKPSDKLIVIIRDKLKKTLKKVTRAVLRYAAGGLLAFLIQIAITAIPVVLIIAILYNSPLALFLPALEEGETVSMVLSVYEDEFYQKIDTESKNLNDCSYVQVLFQRSNNEEGPGNYNDVLCIYMIKYGSGDIATIMNNKTKKNLLDTFNHMCRYTVSYDIQIIETTVIEIDDEGNETEVTEEEVIITKIIKVTLLDVNDIIDEGDMDQDEILLLRDMMNQLKLPQT